MNSHDRPHFGLAFPYSGQSGGQQIQSSPLLAGPSVARCNLAGAALTPGERGVVLAPPLIEDANGRLDLMPFDRSSVLAALLFWDVIEYPSFAIFEMTAFNFDDLEAMGAVQRSEVLHGGKYEGTKTLFSAANTVVRRLSERDPGRWSVWRQPGTVELGIQSSLTDAATVKLTQAILLPPIDAPYQDVLEFRERRRDELRFLRDKLDTLGATVASAADSERAFVKAQDEVVASLAAARRVTNERWGLARAFDMELSFDLTSAIRAAVYAGAASALVKDFLIAAVVGGATLAVTPRRRPSLGPTANPFDVICRFEREMPTR